MAGMEPARTGRRRHDESRDARLVSGQLAASIAPTLGASRMDKLSQAAIRRWQTDLLAKPSAYQPKPKSGEPDPPIRTLSARTVAYCHAILRAALNDALQDEVPGLRRNVVALVEPPKVRGRKGTALTVEQLTAVLAVIDQDSLRVLWFDASWARTAAG